MALNPMFQPEIKPDCLPWWCVVSQVGSAHLIGCSLIIISSFLCVCVFFFFFLLWCGGSTAVKINCFGEGYGEKRIYF